MLIEKAAARAVERVGSEGELRKEREKAWWSVNTYRGQLSISRR